MYLIAVFNDNEKLNMARSSIAVNFSVVDISRYGKIGRWYIIWDVRT